MFHMFPAKCCALKGLHSCILTQGLQIGSFWLSEFTAPYHAGFLNSHPVVILSLHNCLGALHPGIEVLPWVDNLGSFNGSSFFSSSLVQQCLKIPNCPLPFKVQRPFNWKHMIDSQVGISLKLREVHCLTVTATAICHCCGRIMDRITLHGGLHLWNTYLRGSVQWQDWHLCLLWWWCVCFSSRLLHCCRVFWLKVVILCHTLG